MRIAGIDIGGTSVKLGVLDTEIGLLETERIPTGTTKPEIVLNQIAEYVNRKNVEFCGVGTAGYVDIKTGTVTAENLRWSKVPVRSILEQATKLPVWVDNDANAALMAEWFDGAARDKETAVILTLGTGVGGAITVHGRPWRGHTNTACELGHIITHADGRPCTCGENGCFEQYASAGALMRYTKTDSIVRVVEGLEAGDREIEEGFRTYIHELSIGVISFIMTFNPQAFILGGGLASSGGALAPIGSRLLDGVKAEVAHAFRDRPYYFTGEICLAKHGNDAGMIGAAMLAMQNLSANQ